MAIIAHAATSLRVLQSWPVRGILGVRFGIPAAIALIAASWALAAPIQAQEAPIAPEGTFVRITLDGGVSPFQSVQYDLTLRGRTVVVTLVKESLCYRGQQERLRLVDGDEARALMDTLKTVKAFGTQAPTSAVQGRARDSKPPGDVPRYEFWSAWGGRMTRFSVSEAILNESPDLMRVFVAVRGAVTSRVGGLRMRDLYHPSKRLGALTITATEAATATLDGWDTFPLPVESLEVVEGDHRVLVIGESGQTREFRVRVVAGGASRIHVLLDGQE